MKFLKIFALIAILITSSMAKKEALIIGVSDYYNSDLNGIERDIYNIETLLKKWGFHVTKLTESDSLRIEDKLREYQTLSPNDTFLFYFSGHGYHVPDENKDESDGQDETLVLSNSQKDFLFLDDTLFGYLNKIQAKKLIVLDSCHSGTAFKDFNNGVQPKTLPEGAKYEILQTKAFRRRESNLNSGKYIVLSASQDSEVSLATPNGSLFTNALVSNLKSGGDKGSILDLKLEVEGSIRKYCTARGRPMQHPNFTVSNPNLQNISLSKFLNGNSTSTTSINPKPKLSIKANKYCKENELLSFNINIEGGKGYLTIFSIEKGEPFIMTQTSKPVGGYLRFQDDFNINPPIECYKDCENCDKEESNVYVILSPKKLTLSEIKSKGLILNNKGIGMRAFRHRSSGAFEPIIAKVRFSII